MTALRSPAPPRQHLLFNLDDERYGLEISCVREILEFGALTAVPLMPAHLRGVINLRGRVVPIIDLKARFGQGLLTVGRRTSIVVVELPGEAGQPPLAIGIMVSGVTEVIEFAPDCLEPAPALGAAIRASFIRGLARHGGTFVVLLELGQVLSVPELSAMAAVPDGGADVRAA